MKIKILSLLPLLLLLQACVSDPSVVNLGGGLKVTGGTIAEARENAIKECKKYNPFFFEVNFVGDKASINGRIRYFKCQFWDSDNDLKRPTSIQQRTMQARRFNASEKEIRHAISAWVAHSGATGSVTADIPKIDEQGQLVPTSKGSIFVMYGGRLLPLLSIHGIYYKSNGDDGMVVRLRTFSRSSTTSEEEIFSPKLYQLIFNQIAQELFTEAIPINPALMQ